MACRRSRNRMKVSVAGGTLRCCTKAPECIWSLYYASPFTCKLVGFKVGLPGLEPGTSSLSETKACVVDVRCCSVNPAKWQFFNLQLSRAFAAVHGRCRQTVVNCRTRCRYGEISCRRVLIRLI